MSVYTQVSKSQLETLLQDYDLGLVVSIEPVAAGIENTNYKIKLNHDGVISHYFFTIFENIATQELHFFLPLFSHLKTHGCHLPAPIKQRNGENIFIFENKPGAIFECLTGHHIENIQAHHCQRIGEELANIHVAAQNFPQQHKNPRGFQWVAQIVSGNLLQLPKIDWQFAKQALTNIESFHQHWQTLDLPFGFIHGDLFNDNCLFSDDGEINGVIDFYAGGDDFWIYDIAITLMAWTADVEGFDPEKQQALIKGYESVRTLTPDEQMLLPQFMCLAALRFYLTRVQSAQLQQQAGLQPSKDPKYMQNILTQFLDQALDRS